MLRLRAVSSVVAGLALMGSRARAQDTASRAARAIDLAAAHAVAQDSVAASARQWRDVLARSPESRFAALGLASLSRLTDDSTGDVALARLAGGGDALARRALLDRAAWRTATGHFTAADSLYAEVVAIASRARDSIVESEAELGRLTLAVYRFDPQAAQRLWPLADSVRPPSDLWLAAATACARAAAHPSDSALQAATAQADRIGDARLAASCLYPLPAYFFNRGSEDSSDRAAAEVIARLRRARDGSTLGLALMFRCYHRLTDLDYSGSAADCEEAVRQGRAVHSPYTVGWAELNLGSLSRLLGDNAAARAHNALGRAALTLIDDQRGLGILRRNDADLALDAGDTAAARVAALDALRDARPAGVERGAAWRRIADVALRERRFIEARRDLDSDIALAIRGHAEVFVPATKLAYGTVLLREGRPRAALARLIPSVYDTTQLVSRYLVEEQRVEALLALGKRTRALTEMERATDELERWRATLGDRDLRVLAFQTRSLFGGPSPAIAAVVASAVGQGESDRAFALAERRRARDLADQRRRGAVIGGADDPVAGSLGGPILSLTALRRAVPDDSTALLEYVTGPVGAPTTVFAVTRTAARARTLVAADSLADDIALFDALIDQRHDARGVALALGNRVLGPALAILPPRIVRLVIVADGPLHRIPFAALRLADGGFVVDRYAVALAPSASVAVGLWSHPPERVGTPARVLAFGGATSDRSEGSELVRADRAVPSSDASDDAERMATPGPSAEVSVAGALAEDPLVARGLPPLPWSGEEATMVAAFGQASVVHLGRDATPAVLAEAALDSFAIVHFATHAIVDEQVPARSALVLTPPRPTGSGLVHAGWLESRHIAATVVVLSACRTARGQLVEGEGVRGLANPFLGAGAHAVLATQWGVGDRAVVPLVYVIYRGLASGLPVVEALRRAEAAARRRGVPVREWAAFTLIGDPLVRVNLQTPSPESVPEWVRSAATDLAPGNQ